ncbi:hypothetical protein FQN54_006261 [Arachnomyces sp. PD_36]|nr:hypothetical protein FQN54_006261 [Arachnomyces sp. PD_36]
MPDQTPSESRSQTSSSSFFVFTPSSSTESTSGKQQQQRASTPLFSFGGSSPSRPAPSSTSTSTSSWTPYFTPSSTPFAFGESRPALRSTSTSTFSGTPRFTPSSTPFAFDESRPALSGTSSSSSGTPRFTPSSTPSTFGEERSWTPFFTGNSIHDPDRPLPSVERGNLSTNEVSDHDAALLQEIGSLRVTSPRMSSGRRSSTSTIVYTPSASTNADSTSQISDRNSVLQEIDGLRSLRITSPETSSSHQSPTGTAAYTPSASTNADSARQDFVPQEIGGRRILRVRSPRLSSSHRSSTDTTVCTPSTSTSADSTRPISDQDPALQQIDDLRSFRITSPRTPGSASSQRHARTPSITISPVAPSGESDQPRAAASRADSFADGVAALRIGSLGVDSPETSGFCGSRSPSPSRRRRRSGSGINRESPHQVENEEPPQALFYKPEVQEALASARTLTSRMVDVLSSSDLHRENGSSIQSLHQQAVKLNGFQLPSSRVVGLVGDSGAGKSFLINSLLDKEGLARSSGGGSACTCAVTEYFFHDRDDLIIHVDYFALDELEKQFEELLGAYRDYASLPTNPSGRNGNESDKHYRELLRKKSKLARATFKASFRESLEREPAVLSSMPFRQAVGRMVEWASELLSGQGREERFDTVEECSSRLGELTSESDDSSPNRMSRTLWPFIQKLRVYVKAHILSKGLILADLPGLRDLNSARKSVTEHYVRQCHQILVIARIDRITTDESVKEIFSLATRANLSQIDVVCTRAGEIQASEARNDYPDERATIDDMQRTIDADTKEINFLREEIRDYDEDPSSLTREEAQELLVLQQDYLKAVKSSEVHEFELRCFIMKLRNDKVTHGLQKEYGKRPNVTALQIFCVSNTMYRDNREKPATAALPYLKLSGILELRRHCIGIVAESRLRATRTFIREDIPALLGSVELWVEVGSGNASAERKQRVLDAVAEIQREVDELTSPSSPVNGVSRNLIQEFKNQINQRMSMFNFDCIDFDTHRLQNKAGRSGPLIPDKQAGRGWWHSSYSAFCSNYGDHSTPKVGYHCWNKEAMASMNDDMSPLWRSFVLDLAAHLDRLDAAVTQTFSNARRIALSTCENGPAAAANNSRSMMRTLAATLHHREDRILDGLEEESENFDSKISSFHTDAFSSIRTAFIGKLMETTYYHAASVEYGPGSDRRRKDLITDKFSSPSLFNDHRRNCKQGFRDIASGIQDKVSEVVNEQVGLVETDLGILRDENVILESERNPAFRRRVEDEVERVRGEVERIGGVVGNVS